MRPKWLFLVLLLSGLRVPAQECRTSAVPVTFYSATAPLEPGAAVRISAKVDGKPAQILATAQNLHPDRVVMMVDFGRYLPKEVSAVVERSLVDALLHTFPNGEQVGLLAFGRFGSVRLPIGSAHEEIERRLARLRGANADALRELSDPPKNHSLYLWDALESAVAMFGAPQVGDAIVVMTDGYDPNSHVTPAKVRDRMLRAGIRLIALGTTTAFPRTHYSRRQELVESFSKVVKATGGITIGDEGTLAAEPFDETAAATVQAVAGFMEIRLQLPSNFRKKKLEMVAVDADARPVGIRHAQRVPDCTIGADDER